MTLEFLRVFDSCNCWVASPEWKWWLVEVGYDLKLGSGVAAASAHLKKATPVIKSQNLTPHLRKGAHARDRLRFILSTSHQENVRGARQCLVYFESVFVL